jgi:hypothetical protein
MFLIFFSAENVLHENTAYEAVVLQNVNNLFYSKG